VRLPLTHAVLGAIAQWLNAVAQAAPTATVTLVLPPFEGRVQAWNAETASFEALRAALPDATALAHSLGLRFGVEADAGVPRCAVPDDAPWITPSLPSEVTCTYGNVCERCALRNDCAGLSHDYAYLRGTRELAPVAREGAPLPSTEAAMGVSRVRGGGDDRGWADRLRERLTDRADAVVALGDVIPHEALAPWPCALPWTRLEVNNLTIGPCCSDYQSFPAQFRRGPSLAAYWNGPAMRAFRHAMVQGPPLAPCRTSCPYLMGATQAPPTVRLFGGPGDFVERQIELVDDMLAGREVMRGGPLKVSFTTTTYCNYDCLMCAYGEIGTLDDELPVSFYEDLALIAPGLRLIEALGGEPLASGVFREFLASFAFERFPALRLALITNGSYLTPKEQKRWQRVPFDNLTISLNAASPESYLAVNRGLSWERVRENLDALLQRRRDGELRCSIVYSMVILKRNLHEIRQFAELARRDGVGYRYLLPNHDRNGQSILTSREAMTEALSALEDVLAEEWARGNTRAVETLFGEVRVLEHRLAHNIVRTIPDGVTTRNG
jgi:molybdenum cofactor biosynthesis enzyme MoaA